MEHDEEFLMFSAQYLVENWQQVSIIDIAFFVHLGQFSLPVHFVKCLTIRLVESLVSVSGFDESPFVSLFTQEVDEGVVGELIAQENGMETGFPEGCQDSLFVEQTLEVAG